MRSAQPPKIPTWLLVHFGSSPNNPELLGDLAERYQRGRSHMWYWRQTAVAIVVSFLNEVWTHKLLTLKVIVFGWAIRLITWRGLDVIREILSAFGSWSRNLRSDWITIAAQCSWIVLLTVIGGSLIPRFSRQSPKAMVLVCAAYFACAHLVLAVVALLRGTPFELVSVLAVVSVIGVLIGGGVFALGSDYSGRAAVS